MSPNTILLLFVDDASEDLLKVTDVWSYFDTDSGGKRAQCTVCRITVGNEYDELKAHLKDNHPKLLLQLLQNKDSDAASNDGDEDENTYTEIVYLEQEPTENVTKNKEKPKSFPKSAKKRERLQSRHSSDDIPLKKIKQKEEESDELGSFIQYITCLLKKLPADVFSNVQIEIINTILKANSQANTRSMVLSNERLNTSSNIITVDGITPVSSTMMGHNYTITLAPKESETENGN